MALPTAITLEVAFSTDPLSTPTWTDISAYLIEIGLVSRGRNRELDRIQGSRMSLRLDNNDRRFDPTYTSGPYYPNVVPMRAIRLRVTHGGTTYHVYRGFVDDWPPEWAQPGYSEVAIGCSCGFKVCEQADLGSNLTQALSGSQIGACLDQIGWPAGDRSIDTGQSTVLAATIAADDGLSALSRIQDIADTELGIFFMDAQGRAVFHDRHKRLKSPYTTSQATFGDDEASGELPYELLAPSYDETELKNDVRVTRSGGTVQTRTDSPSITRYGKRTHTRSTLQTSDTEAADMAAFLVSRYKDPALRFRQIEIKPLDDDDLWAQVLGRELGDRITVKRRPPGGGAVVSQACSIESIEHRCPSGNAADWTTRFDLSPADEAKYWVLGDAVNGLLGETTRLAY